MNIKKEIISKFFENRCSEQELKAFRVWLTNPENEDEVTALFKSSWDEMKDKKYLGKSDNQGFNEILKRIDHEKMPSFSHDEENDIYSKPKRTTRIVRPWHWKAAASFILSIGLTYVIMSYMREIKFYSKSEVVHINKVNPKGQKSTIMLPDGTMVNLNSESSISYTEPPNSNNRKVTLKGEAFFMVEKDPTRPFIVSSSHQQTTALGTSFNIRAYPDENETVVSLTSGKVAVKSIYDGKSKTKLVLSPGEQAVINEFSIVRQDFDRDRILAWKNGIIYFDNTDFYSTLKILERWYDVDFEVINARDLKNKKGTGKFVNQNLSNVLMVLGYSMGFEYEIKNKHIIIKF